MRSSFLALPVSWILGTTSSPTGAAPAPAMWSTSSPDAQKGRLMAILSIRIARSRDGGLHQPRPHLSRVALRASARTRVSRRESLLVRTEFPHAHGRDFRNESG